MISSNFYDSVDAWIDYVNRVKKDSSSQEDGETGTDKEFFSKASRVPIKKILSLVFMNLEKDENVKIPKKEIYEITDLIDCIRYNTKSTIEKAFYEATGEISKTVSRNSLKVYASFGRKALGELGLNERALRVPPKAKEDKDDENKNDSLPPRIKCLSDDDAIKQFFILRREYFNKHRSIRSDVTIRNMMRFWCSIIEKIKEENPDANFIDSFPKVEAIVNSFQNATDHQIIDLFHMFEGTNEEWSMLSLKKFKFSFSRTKRLNSKSDVADDDKDKHRLSSRQQEDIYSHCKTPFEKVVVSLLFTTGLRVNGLRTIKLKDICDKTSTPIKIFDFGKTIEKGNKTRTFPLTEMTKPHIQAWIDENHMVESEYLFPSPRITNQPMSVLNFQTMFKEVAKRAGYEGPEIHVHAARHSVAFNLLESGNSMDKIGKFLGHANPATTAKFYAKMSTKETIERMNTECIGGKNNLKAHVPDVPNFNKSSSKREKRTGRRNYLEKLKDISIVIS